jgi:Tfp pilus assembly protein PilO
MKPLVGRFLAALHWIILMYAGWDIYELQGLHTLRIQEIRDQAPTLEANIAKQKKELRAIDTYKKNIDTSRKNVEEAFKNIELVQKQLPTAVSDIEILDFFSREGRELNIQDLTTTPLGENSQGFYKAKSYLVKASGTYLQFIVFMERLAVAERLFNVKRINLATATDGTRGRFQIVTMEAEIETFTHNPDHKETSGLEEIDAQFAAPAAAAPEAGRRRRPKASRGGGGDDE